MYLFHTFWAAHNNILQYILIWYLFCEWRNLHIFKIQILHSTHDFKHTIMTWNIMNLGCIYRSVASCLLEVRQKSQICPSLISYQLVSAFTETWTYIRTILWDYSDPKDSQLCIWGPIQWILFFRKKHPNKHESSWNSFMKIGGFYVRVTVLTKRIPTISELKVDTFINIYDNEADRVYKWTTAHWKCSSSAQVTTLCPSRRHRDIWCSKRL